MKVNGRDISIRENITINEFLLELNLNPDNVVIEVDGEIIIKENFTIKVLKKSNIVEVVSFVGGG